MFHGDGIQVIRDTPNLSRVFHGILCNLQGLKNLRMFLNVWGKNVALRCQLELKVPKSIIYICVLPLSTWHCLPPEFIALSTFCSGFVAQISVISMDSSLNTRCGNQTMAEVWKIPLFYKYRVFFLWKDMERSSRNH